jgi:hypothetical protein
MNVLGMDLENGIVEYCSCLIASFHTVFSSATICAAVVKTGEGAPTEQMYTLMHTDAALLAVCIHAATSCPNTCCCSSKTKTTDCLIYMQVVLDNCDWFDASLLPCGPQPPVL